VATGDLLLQLVDRLGQVLQVGRAGLASESPAKREHVAQRFRDWLDQLLGLGCLFGLVEQPAKQSH
jgi:hypothetical protein